MWSLGSTLFMLLFAGVPIGISLAGATALGVLFDDFLTYSTLFEAFFSFNAFFIKNDTGGDFVSKLKLLS